MPLSIEKEIEALRSVPEIGHHIAEALRKIMDSTNSLGQNLGADPTVTLPAPPTVQELSVKTNGAGLVHATVTDNNAIQKNVHYFVEYANEPNFLQPHVEHLGASRSMKPTILPALDDDGNPQKWYFRAYSQSPGGLPSPVVHFGGTTPTAVDPGGTQQMTLIPSTGSGTAQATGQEGGSGFGKVLNRPAFSTKRSSQQA